MSIRNVINVIKTFFFQRSPKEKTNPTLEILKLFAKENRPYSFRGRKIHYNATDKKKLDLRIIKVWRSLNQK